MWMTSLRGTVATHSFASLPNNTSLTITVTCDTIQRIMCQWTWRYSTETIKIYTIEHMVCKKFVACTARKLRQCNHFALNKILGICWKNGRNDLLIRRHRTTVCRASKGNLKRNNEKPDYGSTLVQLTQPSIFHSTRSAGRKPRLRARNCSHELWPNRPLTFKKKENPLAGR